MTQRPFRFGIMIQTATSPQAWRTKALKTEDLGYSSFLVPDHLWYFPPIVGLIEAAHATTTLRVGAYVFGNDFRHPAHLAREAAALDFVSDGRLEFGLGTGYDHRDYRHTGLKLDAPGVRVSRFEEALQVVKGLWTNERFTFRGRYYSIDGLECVPKPVQKPHPPIIIGGGGKRILSIAAREADIIGINFKSNAEGGVDVPSITVEATSEKIAWIREAAGERFNDLELSINIAFAAITDHPYSAAEGVATAWRRGGLDLQIDQILATPHTLIGTVDAIVNDLQELRERYGISYIIVKESQLDDFAPIVARLTGT